MAYRDNSGIEHESYEAACEYYGADTPAQVEAEEQYWAEIEADEAAEHGRKFARIFAISPEAAALWAADRRDNGDFADCPF